MVQHLATSSFRAFFNETSASADECETLVRNAIDDAPGLSLDGDLHTIATDYGKVQNITIDFDVAVEDTPDARTPRGRLLATLMGNNPFDGLTQRN